MSQFWTDDKIRTLWRYPDKMPEAKYGRLRGRWKKTGEERPA